MKKKTILVLVIALMIYLAGFALRAAFNGFVLWGNLEGQSFWGYPESITYDSALTAEADLVSLDCPILLTPGEVGTIEVTVANPNDYRITAWISAHVSKPDQLENMVRQTRRTYLEPGESSVLSWKVSEDNIIHGRMILFRVFLRLTQFHPPARTNHCGIMFIDLWGLSGSAIVILSLVGSHILQGMGIFLWWRGKRQAGKKDQSLRNILLVLSFFSLVMSVGSLSHSWILGIIGLVLSLLLVFTSIGYSIGKTDH